MQSKILLLNKKDLVCVAAIANQSEYNSWTSKTFADCLKDEYISWVIKEDGEVKGFLITLIQCNECQIMNIGVDESSRRKGFARSLLGHLIQNLNTINCHKIFLEVRESNFGAISLYESFDFKRVGMRHGYYPQGVSRENAVVYVRLSN